MMKSSLAIILTISFIAIALFSFAAMDSAMRDHKGCVAAVARNAPCPEAGLLEFLIFHLGVFKNFTSAAFELFSAVAAYPALILLFSAVLLCLFYFGKKTVSKSDNLDLAAVLKRIFEIPFSSAKERILYWLSLLEQRAPKLSRTHWAHQNPSQKYPLAAF